MPFSATLLTLAWVAMGQTQPVASPNKLADEYTLLGINAAERLSLAAARGPVEMEVDALAARITLRTKDPRALALPIARQRSAICPDLAIEKEGLVLICRTRKFRARIVGNTPAERQIDLRELRGIPFEPGVDGPPIFNYPPEQLGFGGPCPGTTAFGKAECLWETGEREAAKPLFETASKTVARGLSFIRLGDLALMNNNPTLALQHYEEAGYSGYAGRLATARICELTGDCIGTRDELRVFESTGVPEPIKTELELRYMRFESFLGRVESASNRMAARFAQTDRPPLCASAQDLCQRLILEALEALPPGAVDTALSNYLASDLRHAPALRAPLALAASRAAKEMGAPVFAASLLSSSTPVISQEELPEHLLEVCELFLAGDDTIRAGAVMEFAVSRLGEKIFRAPRWARVARRVRRTPADVAAERWVPPTVPDDVDFIREMAQATLARSQARHEPKVKAKAPVAPVAAASEKTP